MLIHILFSLSIGIALLPTLGACNALAPRTAIEGDAALPEAAARELFEAESFDMLLALPAKWRSELSVPERKFLVALLIPKLWSSDLAPLEAPSNVAFEAQYDWSRGYPKAVRDAQVRVRHDLTTIAGRATWAIEELLLCSLPVVIWNGCDHTARSIAIAMACQEVVKAMEMPLIDGTGRAPLEVRRAAAASAHAPQRMLEVLAADGAVEVRAAVASNSATPIGALRKLATDRSDLVRKAAEQNLAKARSLKHDITRSAATRPVVPP